jgi:hypothetical protein
MSNLAVTANATSAPRDLPENAGVRDLVEPIGDEEKAEVPPGYGPDPDYAPDTLEPDPTPALPDPPAQDAER